MKSTQHGGYNNLIMCISSNQHRPKNYETSTNKKKKHIAVIDEWLLKQQATWPSSHDKNRAPKTKSQINHIKMTQKQR